MKDIPPEELNRRLHDDDTDEVLIDVRSPAEYKSGHIAGAKNLPLDSIEKAAGHLKEIDTVYVVCGTGARSRQACKELEARGVHVVNVEGGVSAWIRKGLPVAGSGKRVIPIIRQVMIAAGSLVLAGVVLGWLVHPSWYVISAFVGAGLLFAGVTGICALYWILERMPWNK